MSVIESSPAVTPIEIPEPNEAQQILLAARDLIADESKWCTDAWDKHGSYCVLGAIGVATGIDPDRLVSFQIFDRIKAAGLTDHLIRATTDVFGYTSGSLGDIAVINDAYGHRAVMRLLNRAIELAGQRA